MKFEKFTTAEKVKIFDKMMLQAKKSYEDDKDSNCLYDNCKVSGFVFYEQIRNRIQK